MGSFPQGRPTAPPPSLVVHPRSRQQCRSLWRGSWQRGTKRFLQSVNDLDAARPQGRASTKAPSLKACVCCLGNWCSSIYPDGKAEV
jgi:hypothetical protein